MAPRINKTLLAILLGAGALAGSGFVISNRHAQMVLVQANDGTVDRVHVGPLFNHDLIRLRDGVRMRLPLGASHTMVIFLSGTECSNCLLESRYWDKLTASDPARLRVAAVLVNATDADRAAFLRGHATGYDVYRFADAGVEKSIGIGSATPLKVLVDTRGRVKSAFGPTSNPQAQQRFYDLVHNAALR
ncbi:MAG TPA: hypothetical protein VIX89_02935 [Bryobacteraceae bacterium]